MRRRPPRPTRFPYTTLFRPTPAQSAGGGSHDSRGDPALTPPGDGLSPGDVLERPPGPRRPRPEAHPELARGEGRGPPPSGGERSEEHTSELQSRQYLVCGLL